MAMLQREARIGAIDAAILIGGMASLIAFYPPAIVAFAVAHLACCCLAAPSKPFWAATSIAMIAAQVAVAWLTWRFVPSPLLALLGTPNPDWLILIAAAVLTFGVCGVLLSAAGNNDRLSTYIQRFGELGI